MSLKDQLKQEVIVALKRGDRPAVDALRYLVSLLDKKEMSLPLGKMGKADEVAVLKKELKNKQESREMFLKGDRADLVAGVDFEIKLLKSYLPPEMSLERLEEIVAQVIAEKGSNFGLVMGETMKRSAGEADGSMVAAVVKKKLSETE